MQICCPERAGVWRMQSGDSPRRVLTQHTYSGLPADVQVEPMGVTQGVHMCMPVREYIEIWPVSRYECRQSFSVCK